MRRFAYILIFLLSTVLIACKQSKTKYADEKKSIDLATVDDIVLKKSSDQKDSLNINMKLLTDEQSKWIVDKWNNAKSKGPCKYVPTYWLEVHFKDGTKRTFLINGQTIKESNDDCYDLGDSKYLEQLWPQTK